MEAAAAPSTVAGPSTLWRLTERRSRKAGSPNIFGGVNLRQLQRLFRAAGDQYAEQRAQLVWGHGDEAGLAQALVGLRVRSRRSRLRTEGSQTALGPRWLTTFGHLRIGEAGSQGKGEESSSEPETGAHVNSDSPHGGSSESQGYLTATDGQREPEMSQAASVGSLSGRTGLVLRRGCDGPDPEHYLHRIIR